MSEEPSPKPEPAYLNLSPVGATSAASAHLTTPVYLQGAAASASSASATLSAIPLVQVASAAVYPSAGPSQVSITPRADSPLPDVDVSLAENAWDLATLGTGFGVGYAFGHLPGGVIGGVGCYLWGRVRWHQVQRKKP